MQSRIPAMAWSGGNTVHLYIRLEIGWCATLGELDAIMERPALDALAGPEKKENYIVTELIALHLHVH